MLMIIMFNLFFYFCIYFVRCFFQVALLTFSLKLKKKLNSWQGSEIKIKMDYICTMYMYVALILSVAADWQQKLVFIQYQTSGLVFSATLSKFDTLGQISIRFFIIILSKKSILQRNLGGGTPIKLYRFMHALSITQKTICSLYTN